MSFQLDDYNHPVRIQSKSTNSQSISCCQLGCHTLSNIQSRYGASYTCFSTLKTNLIHHIKPLDYHEKSLDAKELLKASHEYNA